MLTEHELTSGMKVLEARPEGRARRPGVVLLHERYGIDQHTKDLGEKLAADGFVALLPDMFHRFGGDREALRRGEERAEMADDEALADLDEAVAFLRGLPHTTGEIGIIGVCQSGRQPLLFAAHRHDVASVAVLYGGVGDRDWEPDERRPSSVGAFIRELDCPVLGLFGEEDHVVSLENVRRFRDELEQANKSYRMRIYRGAPHGWLNDTMPGRYRREAAEAAWSELTSFLREAFAGEWHADHVVWEFASDVSPGYDFSKNVRLA
ncbi:MAG: dienelactone hydrolase family protein [Chloroflexi bacterium]|nr:dienelactone hydrolase family protein [Chloroflexota bacterium]